MKRLSFAMLIVSSVLLAACDGAGLTIDVILNDAQTIGLGTRNSASASGSVTRSDSDVYTIQVSNIAADQDVVYFEADTEDVELTLYIKEGGRAVPVRQANTKRFFGEIDRGLAALSLDSQSIIVDPIDDSCLGSCIIVDKGEGTVYLRVRSRDSQPANYQLYVYADSYRDETEPRNEPTRNGNNSYSCNFGLNSQSIVITPDQPFYEGAIETVEDVDCFSSQVQVGSVNLSLDENTTFAIKARLLNSDGQQLIFLDGSPAVLLATPNSPSMSATIDRSTVTEGVLVEVSSADGRAAAPANARYTFAFGN